MDCFKQVADQKHSKFTNRKDVEFHQDNARPHTLLTACRKLKKIGWEVLFGLPYSSEIESSDYHLFLSIGNALGDITSNFKEACKNWLFKFFLNDEKAAIREILWSCSIDGNRLLNKKVHIWSKLGNGKTFYNALNKERKTKRRYSRFF